MQTKVVIDVYKPVCGWKKPNSTISVIDGKQIIFEYAMPGDVPQLMEKWLGLLRNIDRSLKSGNKQQVLRNSGQKNELNDAQGLSWSR